MKEESLQRALDSLQTEVRELNNITKYLDRIAFGKAVDAIVRAKKVITSASGASGIAAKKFAHTLCCIEKSSQFLSPCEAMHGGLGAVKEGDVMVMVSRGGKTAELFPIAEVCKKKKATLLIVTENIQTGLAQYADILLPMKIGMESDKYNVMATSSFLVTVAIFDAIICAVMEETDFTKEMFALIHPGGAVGARLNAR